MNLELIKEKVLDVYKECNIHTFPIDCFAILSHYGIRTITYCEVKNNNPELYQAIANYSNDAFRFRMSVYYNSSNSSGRIRFSLMHELGHYILDHREECLNNENEADCFASYMIAPRVAIDHLCLSTADDLHDIFGLSYAAANRTLCDYKQWKNIEHGISDDELRIWLYYPNFYRHRERHLKNQERERRKLDKKAQFYEQRCRWIEENIPNYSDYLWNQYDQTFY